MAGFTAPAGQSYVTPVTNFEKTPNFRAGIATTPPGVTTPSVPLTTVPVANSTGVDVVVYLLSGTGAVTVISVNGVATGLQLTTAATSCATVYLPAGATISWTGGGAAPTWVWMAV